MSVCEGIRLLHDHRLEARKRKAGTLRVGMPRVGNGGSPDADFATVFIRENPPIRG